MRGLDLPTLVIAHAWVLIAFTVLVGALSRIVKDGGPRYWLYSDFAGLLSLFGIYLTITRGDQLSVAVFAFSTYLTLHYRVLALASSRFANRFQKISLISLLLLMICNLILFDLLPSSLSLVLRTLINAIAFLILSVCMIYAAFKTPDIENKFGRFLIVSAALAYIAVAMLRTVNILRTEKLLVNYTASFNTTSLTILMLLGIFAHIGFIIIVLDKLNRAESRAAQALVREAERRHSAELREKESASIADEQRRLIEVLTHEVRQPLNNASAALQSIGNELTGEKQSGPPSAIKRAQAVLDKVAMALSNALVAATIIERQQKFNPVRYDPLLLVDMAVMDFNEKDRARIQLEMTSAPLYISADPVLLRIALRNLLDNALRYSPAGSGVTLQLVENEDDIGAEFRVINNEPQTLDLSETDIFARRIRGRSGDIDGSGMGLYITSEIAKLHQGWVRTWPENGQRIFALFIQD